MNIIEKEGKFYISQNDSEILLENYPSQSKIEQWKKTHKNVFRYISKDGKWIFLKSPSLTILDACRTISRGNNLSFDIALKNNCKLESSPEFDTSDEHILGLSGRLGVIIKKVDGQLEEL